ncbi:MAG: signal recognition particle-docking protein FtsY [Infirmifilum sp.]|uniref:signal recognition particle-docking protein FtsY n=1 Tax=Infirmifilum TaxID=2856573 RepID=UPI002355E4F9
MSARKLSKIFREFVDTLAFKELTPERFDEAASKLFIELVQSDVAVEVAEGIIGDLRSKVVGQRIQRGRSVKEFLESELRATLQEVFERAGWIDLEKLAMEQARQKGVFKVIFLGPNGHGKTTTIGKLSYRFSKKGLRVLIAAADTFRAGAIEQVSQIASLAGAGVFSMGYGADPAAVAYEAVERARRGGYNVVMIDTAGRMHTKKNLMDEMKKIIRVVEPDFKIFVGDALTGNDAVEMARSFHSEVGIDGSIVSKFDADVKGGVVVSLVYVTGRPVLYVGTGQRLEDLEPFDYKSFIDSLLSF